MILLENRFGIIIINSHLFCSRWRVCELGFDSNISGKFSSDNYFTKVVFGTVSVIHVATFLWFWSKSNTSN